MKSSSTADQSRLLLLAARRALCEQVGVELVFRQAADSAPVPEIFIVDITDIGENRVVFCFPNTLPDAYAIADISFHDDEMLGPVTASGNVIDSCHEVTCDVVSLSGNPCPPRSGNPPATHAAGANPAGTDPAARTRSSGQHEFWVIIFELARGTGFADILYALSTGRLRITIRINDIENGSYRLLTNEPVLTLGQSGCPHPPLYSALRKTA